MKMNEKIKHVVIFGASVGLAAVIKGFDFTLELHSVPHFSLFPLCLVPVALISWHLGRGRALLGAFAIAIGWVIVGQESDSPGPLQMVRGMYNLIFASFFMLLSIFVTNLVQSLRRAQAVAWKDDITDTLNAKYFFSTVKREIARAKRYQRAFTIAFISVNGFWEMKKKTGSEITNAMLKRIGDVLQKNIRGVDIVGRVGEDEFSLFLPETGNDGARTALPRVCQALIDALPNIGATPFAVCAIACAQASQSVEGLTATARAEIEAARATGKNEVIFKEA